MINSRLRESSSKLFDCYFEIELKNNVPNLSFKYPDNYNDKQVIKSIVHFCFPCEIEFLKTNFTCFSFVLTGQDSKWSFGFCCHLPSKNKCLALISSFSSSSFFKLLNYISDIKTKYDERHFNIFLESLFKAENKNASTIGKSFIYYVDGNLFSYNIQMNDANSNKRLPCIPDNRNLTEFFNALIPSTMINLFASILNERRIIIHSTRLARLSACVQACNLIIYPMQWQNVFIPILPVQLTDYLNCPTPFLIGVHSSTLTKINLSDLEDVVILDVDTNKFQSPYSDFLPFDVANHLKKGLKKTQQLFGDGLARLFLRSLIMILSGYRQGFRFTQGEKITFNDSQFIQSKSSVEMQSFLEKIADTQCFKSFIENRLDRLNNGLPIDDIFDLELNNYSIDDLKTTSKFKQQYQEWSRNVKKDTSNLVKSINPVLINGLYRNIKDKSKKTYKGFCNKLDNLNRKSSTLNRHSTYSCSNLDLSNSTIYRPLPTLPGLPDNKRFSQFYNEA